MTNEVLSKDEIVAQYSVTDAFLGNLKDKFSELKQIENSKDYKLVMSALSEVREVRIKVEKTRKELKEKSLEYGRMVDGEAKRIQGLIAEIEVPLRELKEKEDQRKAEEEAAVLRAEQDRIDGIKKKIAGITFYLSDLNSFDISKLEKFIEILSEIKITEEEYQEFCDEAERSHTEVSNALKNRLAEKIEQEKAQEELRKAQEEAAILRAEQERKDAEIQAKLDAERKEKEELQRKVEEQERKERERLAEEKRKLEAEELRIRIEKEAKEKAEREAKEKAELAELERIRQEEENRRKEAALPDMEKLIKYGERISLLIDDAPEIKNVDIQKRKTLCLECLENAIAEIGKF